MDVEFAHKDLARLEIDQDFDAGYPPEAVRGFRRVLQMIRDAVDERDLRALRSLNFEKLKGDRSGEYSMRLNKQWRLIFDIVEGQPKNGLRLTKIEDYH